MGVYDFLKGPCPNCYTNIGEKSGDIQIKWFSDNDNCFRTFKPGDILPSEIKDGDYVTSNNSYCNCHMPLLAKVRNNVFVGFILNPEGPIYNINHTTKALRNLTYDFFCDIENNEAALDSNNSYCVEIMSNVLAFSLIAYLLVILIVSLCIVFNSFDFFKSNAGNFIIGSIASSVVTVLAFAFAIWRGDKITEYFSEKRRLKEWFIVGRLVILKLSKLLDKLYYDIFYSTGLPFERNNISLNNVITAFNYYNISYRERQVSATGRIIYSLPDLLTSVIVFKKSLSPISKDYSNSLPASTYKIIVSLLYHIEDLIDVLNEYGGVPDKDAWSEVLSVTENQETVHVFSYFELHEEQRIVIRLAKILKELEHLKIDVANISF